ncbi:MAG: 16S rRNA (cytidine(1402)-2'-O)-methyltransferase [Anaerolineae bacterium]
MGTLYLVGTPIGNLEDITLRALRVLREASLIAAEDTRTARKLLQRYEIATPVLSYWEHNELARVETLLEALERGDVALISEAGMPGISDPGYRVVRAAVERGFPVVPVPGPSAITAAVAASGLPVERFLFLGFLPRSRKARQESLRQVRDVPAALVCYEAPHRIVPCLEDMQEMLGDRQVAVTRELTKVHEEIWRGTLTQALERFRSEKPRGEFTLVVDRAQETPRWAEDEVFNAVLRLVAAGLERKEAFREVSGWAGWSRREVYDLWLRRVGR